MAAPTLTAITTPQNNGSNTLAVNMPGSVVATDLLIVVLSHGGTNVTMPGTNPWHKKIENSNSICVAYLRGSEHIANSSPATYSFTTGGVSAITNAYVIQLAGAIGTGDPFDNLTTGATTAVTSSAALSFNTATVDVYLHNGDFKSAARTLSTPPTGMTQRAGGAGNSFQHAFDSTQGATGGTGTKTSVYTVGSSHSSVLFAVKPVTTQTVSPSGIADTSAVGSPALVQNVTPSGIASTSAVGTPALVQNVTPTGIASTSAVGTPTLLPQQIVNPSGIAATSATGTPTLIQEQFVDPTGIASTSVVGDPTVIPNQLVEPTGIAPTSDVGTPSLVLTVDPTGIAPTSAVGDPTVIPQQMVDPTGIAPTSDVGEPSLSLTIVVDGIASTSVVGVPLIVNGFLVQPEGIAPTSGVGAPTLLPELIVSGVVYNHETGATVGAGVEVKLFNQDDLLIDTTVTAADGSYVFYVPNGTTDTYWTLATYDVAGTQYHGVSDRGCAAV